MNTLILENFDSNNKVFLRRLELASICMVFVSIFTLGASTYKNLPAWATTGIFAADILTFAVFSFEFFYKVKTAKNKWLFIKSPASILSLLATIPFAFIGASEFFLFRVLKVFVIFKLFTENRITQRLFRAWNSCKKELMMFTGVISIFTYVCALGIYFFEHEAQPEKIANIGDALWLAWISTSSVGFGDIYPITMGGRLFMFFMLLIGLGMISVPSALISAALIEARQVELRNDSAEVADLTARAEKTT